MKLLFICNQNQNRSPTAAALFSESYDTRSAGLYSAEPVTKEQLEWADTVIVMEEEMRSEIAKRFPNLYLKKRILCLNIPDMYRKDQPELVELIKERMESLL
ncbi:phosphotyrosine protein phosphatase [Candidatus Woesearchaeota archaeon]|nr:phosphotyrosine protein phosphatase [Candidatus Woesearchaeota archaeon]